MNPLEPTIRVPVTPSNPGQYFACCGLLELAGRLWPGAEGWFSDDSFLISAGGTLGELLGTARDAELVTPEDAHGPESEEDLAEVAPPLLLGAPFRLRLDWWVEERGLKTWAGSMRVELIAAAMRHAMNAGAADPLNQALVAYDPPAEGGESRGAKPTKREPFYFDARRAVNAHALDIGFSPNDLELSTLAHPAVEFLCLVGLQRARPRATGRPRTFDYWTWAWPTPLTVLAVAVAGLLGDPAAARYRFESTFRSAQRKHKALGPAARIPSESTQ